MEQDSRARHREREREGEREGTENDQKMIRNDLNNDDDEAKDIATRHSLLLSLPGSSLPSPAPVPPLASLVCR